MLLDKQITDHFFENTRTKNQKIKTKRLSQSIKTKEKNQTQ